MAAATNAKKHKTTGLYHDAGYVKLEKELETLAAEGAAPAERARFIEAVYIECNRAIRNADFLSLDPSQVAAKYLLPRRDLHLFAVRNWVKHIFLEGLGKKLSDSIFMFGLGRLFSAYNDMGAQHSTDVDLNIVTARGVPIPDLAAIKNGLLRLRSDLLERFGILVELHPDFSVLGEQAVLARLEHPDERVRFGHCLFYKSNERSIHVLHDYPEIREKIFSRVRGLPDAYLFEHFLGLRGGGKSSFYKLRCGEPLYIGQDGTGDAAQVRTVIGSRAYDLFCRRLFPPRLFVSPPEWCFSMKYFVNRCYDYVCAMRNLGHGLGSIGFGPEGEKDADYLYLRSAHKLMLYLQELAQNLLGAYTAKVDASYMSRKRFMGFIELAGDKFRADFGKMALQGDLIPASQARRYRELEAKIAAKARDRFMEGPISDLKCFPPGFRYESTHKGKDGYRINVPYSWGDLGYFAFSYIAERMAAIVERRLLPALPGLGMPVQELSRYRP
jgi:hypothetical protein